jgi:hypothetical protein
MTPVSKTLALVLAATTIVAMGGCKKHHDSGASEPRATLASSSVAAGPASAGAAGPVSPGTFNQKLDANGFPRVGSCSNTTIAGIGSRLEGMPDSGSAVTYADGKSQVSYDTLPGVTRSKPGDPVLLCVVDLPKNCPANDHRGIVYAATNQRSGDTWRASDSEHDCGGA